MRITRCFLILGLCLTSLLGLSQDIHFSQFNAAPMLLNPALTGVHGGNYRLVANYKAQWTGLAPYNTIAASYDMSMFRHTPKSNYGGVGLSFFNDKAGDGDLRTTVVNVHLSYTVMLNKRGTQSLSSGIYGGVGHRTINYSALTFDSQWGPGGFDPGNNNLENFTNDKVLYGDIGAGLLWSYRKSEKQNYYGGVSVSHLNQPNQSFLNEADEKLYIKLTVHGGGHIGITEQIFILPSFMFLNQGPHREFNVGALVKFKKSIVPTDKTAFYFGGWYRVKDALIMSARVDFGDFNVGFSYDVNLSGLTPASHANGGPELSLIYTGFFPSKKNTVRICPTLM